MTIWTLAHHNRTGTGCSIYPDALAVHRALIQTVVDPRDTESLIFARKMLLLSQFDELCAWLQANHFGTDDDYAVQSHEIEVSQ